MLLGHLPNDKQPYGCAVNGMDELGLLVESLTNVFDFNVLKQEYLAVESSRMPNYIHIKPTLQSQRGTELHQLPRCGFRPRLSFNPRGTGGLDERASLHRLKNVRFFESDAALASEADCVEHKELSQSAHA